MRSPSGIVLTGIILGTALVVLLFRGLTVSEFDRKWAGLRIGMREAEVLTILGKPHWTGTSTTIGAGGQDVVIWEYYDGRRTYRVQFEHSGPDGALEIFSWSRFTKRQAWPWVRPRAK
jgi:hypothetical protein